MNICFVTPEFVTETRNWDGGLSNYLFRVSLGLLQFGYKPIIIVSSDKTEIITHHNIEVHRVNIEYQFEEISINWLYQSYIIHKYIKNLLKLIRIDIIQYTSFTGIGYFRISSIPSVVRISSYEPLWVAQYEREQSENQFKTEISAIRHADGIFGPCKLIADEINRNENINISIIESPFINDVQLLDYSIFNEYKDLKYLLFFGTVGLLKGVKTIADTIHRLLSKHPDLSFVFIGKSDYYNGKSMIEYVYQKSGNHRNRVYYINRLNHERLYPFIQNAIAVVLPSRIDNFPNTCIEAMANRKIVIGTKNTGFDQLILNEENGFLCEKDNPESLLQTIEKVLKLDTTNKSLIQDKAKKRIDLLKPDLIINKHIVFYQTVIKNFLTRNENMENAYYDTLTVLWDNILYLNNENKEKTKKILNWENQVNLIINSRTFKLGKLLTYPLHYFRNI